MDTTVSLHHGWLQIAEIDASTLTDQMWALDSSSFCVRFVRGRRMTNAKDLFAEWAAALQFPYYFGQNWDAFDECLADLSWLPGGAYVIVVLDAADILPNDQELDVFLDIVGNVATEWTESSAKPFKVVLQEEPGPRVKTLSDRLERLGVKAVPYT